MSRFVKVAGVLGFSIALLLSIVWRIHNGSKLLPFSQSTARVMEKITLLFWPSSFMLMATDRSGVVVDLVATVLSLLLNTLLYMFVAYIFHGIYKKIA